MALPRLNAEWHREHRMPPRPTKAQRIAWHAEHSLNCACRTMPPALRSEVEVWLAAHRQEEPQ